MAFCLSVKVVALHQDNSTAKVYLWLACHLLILVATRGIILIPAYTPIHLNVEDDYVPWGRLVPEWLCLPCIAEAAYQIWIQLEVDLLASSCTNQYLYYYTLKNPLPVGTFFLPCICIEYSRIVMNAHLDPELLSQRVFHLLE